MSLDGARLAIFQIDPRMSEEKTGLTIKTAPMHVKAGTHRVTAAFIQRFEGLINDLIAPIDHTMADTEIGIASGITTLPHLRSLSIVGPHRVTGVSDTPSRRRVFSCRALSQAEETPCASDIVRRLATQAFRRPVAEKDHARLMTFYARGRKEKNFEAGITKALEAILASPQFLFRVEETACRAEARERRRDAAYRLGDYELASRLSFFLLGTRARRRVAEGGGPGPAGAPRRAREAVAPHAGGAACRCARDAICVAVAAAAGSREGHSGSDPVSLLGSDAVAGVEEGDGAVLRQPRARGPQPARSLDRRLHLRERARRAPLRHSECDRAGIPPRRAAGRSPRHSRPGQHPDVDLDRRAHVAGPARQVGDGSTAGIAAAAAAAERAGARGDEGHRRFRPAADRARAHGAASQQSAVHVVPSRDRSARPGARELRRDRQMAHSRWRHDGGYEGAAVRRHRD